MAGDPGDKSVCSAIEADIVNAIIAKDTGSKIALVDHWPGTTDQAKPGKVVEAISHFEDTMAFVAYDSEAGRLLNILEHTSDLAFSIIMIRKSHAGDGATARIGSSTIIGLHGIRDIVRDAIILDPGGGGSRKVDYTTLGIETPHLTGRMRWQGVTMSWGESKKAIYVAVASVVIAEHPPN